MKYMPAIPLAEVPPAPQELREIKSWRAFNTALHQEVLARLKTANGLLPFLTMLTWAMEPWSKKYQVE